MADEGGAGSALQEMGQDGGREREVERGPQRNNWLTPSNSHEKNI